MVGLCCFYTTNCIKWAQLEFPLSHVFNLQPKMFADTENSRALHNIRLYICGYFKMKANCKKPNLHFSMTPPLWLTGTQSELWLEFSWPHCSVRISAARWRWRPPHSPPRRLEPKHRREPPVEPSPTARLSLFMRFGWQSGAWTAQTPRLAGLKKRKWSTLNKQHCAFYAQSRKMRTEWLNGCLPAALVV